MPGKDFRSGELFAGGPGGERLADERRKLLGLGVRVDARLLLRRRFAIGLDCPLLLVGGLVPDGVSRILRRVRLAFPRRPGRFRGSGIEAWRLRHRRRARRLRRLVGRLSFDLFVIGGAGSVVGGLQVDRSRRRRRSGFAAGSSGFAGWGGSTTISTGISRATGAIAGSSRFSKIRKNRMLAWISKAPKSANPRLIPGRGKSVRGCIRRSAGFARKSTSDGEAPISGSIATDIAHSVAPRMRSGRDHIGIASPLTSERPVMGVAAAASRGSPEAAPVRISGRPAVDNMR